jgi:hypothetical protein
MAAQVFLIAFFVEHSNPFALLAGRWSDGEYLSHQRASFASIAWLNGVRPPQSRTLVVGLGESYWLGGKVRAGGNFDGERIARYLEAPTPEALRARLQRDGITHIAVIDEPPHSAIAQKVEERQTRLTPAAQQSLASFLDRYTAQVVSRDRATLFTLR